MVPFLTSSQVKKADTWIEIMIAKNLHEIVFVETSGLSFQAICTTKKKKCTYLSDWKNLCNNICKSELLLFQAYETKLKILILDCSAHPFCCVREIFDLNIPYKKVAIEEFKLFIQALWAIRYALSDIIHDYEEIGEKLLRDYNKLVRNNKDYLNLDNLDDESTYDLTQDNESVYDLTQDNESVYESTQDSDLIQDASPATSENYEDDEVDLFYENETVEYENIWD
ncbi:40173_t:CDS:2 [Gigaspora margarita]|uniref:40173_t:CDS:1 n=1 Tax=Gigaspora margarita TaxID=4874 RepID=A0ABN7VAK3_GIGMA|nr:40173_t:CDS:2 [Gigaspora margarita]